MNLCGHRVKQPILRDLERIAAERLEAEREVVRLYRRELIRVCLECLSSCVAALLLIGAALHTTDMRWGPILFWSGMLVGYVGVASSLLVAYLRGEERGDW